MDGGTAWKYWKDNYVIESFMDIILQNPDDWYDCQAEPEMQSQWPGLMRCMILGAGFGRKSYLNVIEWYKYVNEFHYRILFHIVCDKRYL